MIKQYVDQIYDALDDLMLLTENEQTKNALLNVSHNLSAVLTDIELELINKRNERMQ